MEELVSKKPDTRRKGVQKEKDSQFQTERIIEALVKRKKLRKYPALPGQICTAAEFPSAEIDALKKYLKDLGKGGILMSSRAGRFRAYMLAGEDSRYATKIADLGKLKFELLGEIEDLKAQLLEVLARGHAEQPAQVLVKRIKVGEVAGLEDQVLQAIAELARKRNTRTLNVWDVRKVFPNLPRETLDSTLEHLGSSWRVELQLVQDSTKLSDEERSALLRLTDGSLVGAVAVAAD
jgi:hypothetical protein